MEFIKGMDISQIKDLEARGAVYYLNGKKEDVFNILKSCGCNTIRLRIWDNPYDESGREYGGGMNNLPNTVELAARAKSSRLNIMLDFHYSDFWTDPSKQIKPKAWKNLSGKELEAVVYNYTKKVLQTLISEGTAPAYVQIGNEITNGLLWPDGHIDNPENMVRLLDAGISAARESCPDVKIILHLDYGTDNEMYRKWFAAVEPYHPDYDIIGMSYYPHWNGSMEKLLFNMNDISSAYGKDVMVAETSIGYTTDNLGCSEVVFTKDGEAATGYPATMDGQEQFLRDLYGTVRQVKDNRGIGVCYWEPAWLPIPDCTWATPAGCAYMDDKATIGNTMANQALFDACGNANKALMNLSTM